MTARLFRDVDLDGRRADVRTDGTTITEVGPGLRPGRESVIAGNGGALIPGLHDHHLHLLALAAGVTSVDLSVAEDPTDVGRLLAERATVTAAGSWIRATGFHERPGDAPVDRRQLDSWCPQNPVRVQHRSGALWILNGLALEALAIGDSPTGRLLRLDDKVRLGADMPDLGVVGSKLRLLGITRVTDATPNLAPEAVRALVDATRSGLLDVSLTLLGAPTGADLGDVLVGAEKLLLHDHDLPTFDALLDRITAAHACDRPVAVHCVTRESLILTLAALESAGSLCGDRIEHGAVVPGELRATIRDLGLTLVTQPDFIRTRGDDYRSEVHPGDVDLLYPYRSLVEEGVVVLPSSDAPFGALDPWQVIRSARDRRTRSGKVLGATERSCARDTLAGYWNGRAIAVGMSADVTLLHTSLADVLDEPRADAVRASYR